MGNCFGYKKTADSVNPSTTTPHTSSLRPSTPGTSTSWLSTVGSGSTCANGEILASANLKIYSFVDLKSATRSFKPDSVLGTGGFGTVYKGWVDENTLAPSRNGVGITVAIKKMNPESTQGFEEWQSEVNFLGRLSHPNVVKLLGYCFDDNELLLVYEFMQKGSLENHLFRRAMEPLSWEIRLKVTIGAAKALAFLHTLPRKVIYRDFKASNILLDRNYNAKISDFGLAKLGPSAGNSHITTRIMGTYGYAAPDDVYGFGVVLLEMLTGLRAFDAQRPSDQQNLVEWAKPMLSQRKKLKTIMDARMEGQYHNSAALHASELTLRCIDEEPKKRPSMKQVMETLEQIEAMKRP
nr:probable serine/threonine-protein kinase Cx32, chloroplastic [Ipomoea batatas]